MQVDANRTEVRRAYLNRVVLALHAKLPIFLACHDNALAARSLALAAKAQEFLLEWSEFGLFKIALHNIPRVLLIHHIVELTRLEWLEKDFEPDRALLSNVDACRNTDHAHFEHGCIVGGFHGKQHRLRSVRASGNHDGEGRNRE